MLFWFSVTIQIPWCWFKLTLEQMMLFVNFVVTISACGVISHMEENASLKRGKEAINLNSTATYINVSYHIYTVQDIRTLIVT